MRVPQVSDRIKEAPAQALRGVFAGIGQLLLITDKLRNKTPADREVPPARAPEPPAPAPLATPVPSAPPAASAPPVPSAPPAASAPPARAAERVTEARDFDKTGNVRLLTSEEAGVGPAVPTARATATVSDSAAAAGGATADAGRGAPLPNYDELSIASLRARLRKLDVTRLRELVGYEQAHAARSDVLAMFERRIAKLEAEASAGAEAAAAGADAQPQAGARDGVAAEAQAEVAAQAEDQA